MKLFKRFTVEGQEYPIVKEDIRLDIDRPGLAIIQVLADAELSGQVEYSMGWNYGDTLTVYFSGEIKTSTTVDAKQQKLLCLELSARIDNTAPISLRHPTLKEVLAKYAELTELSFILPDKSYAQEKVPAFYGFGSAFHAMHSIGQIFHIPDYVWLTQGDGRIFVGSWEDSRWKGREIAVPQEMFKRVSADNEIMMTVAPGVRPGCVVNGKRVMRVNFSGHEARLKCRNS